MFIRLLMITLCFGLIGCRSLKVDVSHASTDKGYLNSGLSDLGKFYYLNMGNGTLTELAEIDLQAGQRGATFEKQRAQDVKGVGIGGALDVAAKAQVEAEIQLKSYIELENAYSISYKDTFSDLSREINARISAGQDLGFEWFLEDAVAPSSPIRYLLLYSTVRADKARVGYNDKLAAEGGFSLPTFGLGEVDIEISGISEEVFSGSEVPVLVKYHVIKAFLNDGKYRFRIDTSVKAADVAAILRGDFEAANAQ